MENNRTGKCDISHLAILLSVASCIGIYLIVTTVLISTDGVFYIEQAKKFSNDPISVIRGHPFGYPFLICIAYKFAALFADSSSVYTWIYSAQGATLLCRLFALVPLYFIGKLLVGSRKSFWAILILVILPYPARFGSDVIRDWPHILFLVTGFLGLLWGAKCGKWWAFGLVGLSAGLGYLIRPMCAQLIVYAFAWLVLNLFWSKRNMTKPKLLAALALLIIGFAAPAGPYMKLKGEIVPYKDQVNIFPVNSAPAITAISNEPVNNRPLSFQIEPGKALTLSINAYDSDGDDLTYSALFIPVGTKPVYRFYSTRNRAYFWTISEHEKNAITRPESGWKYEGVEYYAFPKGGRPAGAKPVYRFWSPINEQHFYTISRLERNGIIANFSEDVWKYEGIVFYAFPKGSEPDGTKPVYRFRSLRNKMHFWIISKDQNNALSHPDRALEYDGTAWYAYAGLDFPAGATFSDRSLNWTPGRNQASDYQVNFTVSDGELENCKVVNITVTGIEPDIDPIVNTAPYESMNKNALSTFEVHTNDIKSFSWNIPPNKTQTPKENTVSDKHYFAALSTRDVIKACGRIIESVSENLMWFFVPALCVGLYHRFRQKAEQQERFLVTAFILINVAMMVLRYCCVQPNLSRRYSLPLISLTVYYIPIGLQLIAYRLANIFNERLGENKRADTKTAAWFFILLTIGLVICIPKLLTPLGIKKQSYETAATWLGENTTPKMLSLCRINA